MINLISNYKLKALGRFESTLVKFFYIILR